MGASTSCSRWDCASAVEDCATAVTPRQQYSFFYDCAGQNSQNHGMNSSGSQEGSDASDQSSQRSKVRVTVDCFAVRHGAHSGAEWRRRYILGRELGAGQTATVFEAFAAAPEYEEVGHASGFAGSCAATPMGGTGDAPSVAQTRPQPRSGRKVALKRFHAVGTPMFQQELQALSVVGIHPHVLRLLESFENAADEDVLVLEHCDGGDVYELYAANNGCCMLEAFVIQLIRQLLLALQHLAKRGVEHRDVKPENLLLYGASQGFQSVPLLKLADFGWAAITQPGTPLPAVPPDGVGSLWYAPPELNPPIAGVDPPPLAGASRGHSDMWSAGVIAYLLLVGHSPFNSALRVTDPTTREAEVIRMAAFGQINTTTRPWPRLSQEARNFILAILQPQATKRLTPEQAWHHPWISRFQDGYGDSMGFACAPRAAPSMAAARWRSLDGFQRLCWLSVARAAAEPELIEVPVLQSFLMDQGSPDASPAAAASGVPASYLEQLAAELACSARPAWFTAGAVWDDVLRLAFRYIDVNGDGALGARDLAQHLVGHGAAESAKAWVLRWRKARDSQSSGSGLAFSDFCWALSSAPTAADAAAGGAPEARAARGPPLQVAAPAGAGAAAAGAARSDAEASMKVNLNSIDEVCQRFLDGQADENSYGL